MAETFVLLARLVARRLGVGADGVVPARARPRRLRADLPRAPAGRPPRRDPPPGLRALRWSTSSRDATCATWCWSGHSFGGSVVSRVSQEIPDRLARLVFHTAFVVEDGASVNDNFPQDQTDAFGAAAAASPDNTVACPWEVFRDLFIQDASPEAARTVWERLVPAALLTLGREARPRRVPPRGAAAQLHRRGRRPRAPARDVAPAHVVAAGRVQARGDGRQPRGDVHAAGRAGPGAGGGRARLTGSRAPGCGGGGLPWASELGIGARQRRTWEGGAGVGGGPRGGVLGDKRSL